MEFRVLGPLEAGDARESLALGPRRQRALLARLLLDAGRTVSVERLLEDLWGEELPETAVKMVQIYVSGLRKALGRERLLTQPSGYCLELGPDDTLDLRRFEQLASAGRTALAQGDPAGAAGRLADAVGLWRGPALAEFAAEPFARTEGERLEELRLAALEDRIEAELALGRAGALVGELDALVEREPLRERPRELLMLALHRSGRQGEALATYHDFRAVLDEQLGLTPSPRLRELEQAILTHDPALDARAPERASAGPPLDAPPGRAAELQALRAAYDAAAAGSRRLVLVSGEPGIGKRTLVEALLASASDALVIHGQCAEQQGAGEAYLPLLDGLARASADRAVAETVTRRAPSWLALLTCIAAEPPPDRARGTTGERMLREMVETLEALSTTRPLLLVIEDLQWADASTRDLLGALVRRRHPARLLVLATGTGPDPLVSTLSLRATAQEVALPPLDAGAVATAFDLEPDAAVELTRRGGGNPLFMQHLVEHLRLTGTLEGVPETLRAALDARLGELDDAARETLQAAAVEGVEFTAAGISAALGRPVDAMPAGSVVEPLAAVEWPDGTHTAAFRFVHVLFREHFLDTIPSAWRAELHRRIGERLEAAFGAAPETARRIAMHYVAGRRPAPAVRFLRLAAAQCVARRAPREAILHLRNALDAAADLPPGPVRSRIELELLSELGQAHVATDGWSSPAALEYLQRARARAVELGDREPLASVLLALATLYEVRGEPEPALDAIAAEAGVAGHGVKGAELLACALFHQGAFTRALEHADRGISAFGERADSGHYDSFQATFGDNAGVACHDWAALALWFLGRAAESMRRALRALELCEEPSRSYSGATARAQLAALHACRDEPEEALRWAQSAIDAARDRGYAYRLAMGRVLRGWAWAALGDPGGVPEIAHGLRASRATGAHVDDPLYLGLLADAHLRAGEPEPGLEAADEALAIAARERAHYYDAELHRLRGRLLIAAERQDGEAEASVRRALAIAREQGARSLELRAALALHQVLSADGRAAEARVALALSHEPLAGEDTPDVRAAELLLAGEADARPPAYDRRRITVVAWVITYIADLARDLDPEQLAEVLERCHEAARSRSTLAGGHVASEDESGGTVYFGYPRALEDGPLRAVRAARALTSDVTEIGDVPVQLSAGIDTGTAVVGSVGRAALAMGRTPRAARRLALDAPPGEVVVSDETRAACEGSFGFAGFGAGYRLTEWAGPRSRLGARGEESSPLVGRERELGLLEGRWEQAAQGLGQALFLTGEAGIGKSRLVRELAAGLDPGACTILEFQCSDARGGSALHPVAEHFRRRLPDGSGGVEALLAEAGIPVAGAAPVVATLLGLAVPAGLEPDALKQRTAEVVVSYVLAEADRRPVMAVFEDAHWADPSTLDLIEELLAATADARVLLIITARPSLRAPWEPHGHASHLSLGPCTREEAEQLVAHVAKAPLPPDVARTVIERGDGIPLFLEELTRAAVAGATDLPATLDASLTARLDALGPAAWAVARLGALIGREFPHELLAAATDLSPQALDRGIESLLGAELLRRRGRARPVRYAFRHALLQEAVIHSMGGRQRRSLHTRIALALERDPPETARSEPDVVAAHLERAGNPGRAVAYRSEAGRLALGRSAMVEAVEQLTQAIADLDASPGEEGHDDRELDLRIPLGNALISARGYASSEVERCYARARALCRRTGDDTRLLPVLYGLWVNAFVRARHERVLELGRELRELAERRDPSALIVAERAVGWPLICMGRYEEAREHLDRIPALNEPDEQHPLRFLYGQDPAVAGLAAGAWALWGCGDEQAADARAEEAITLAHTTEHPLTISYALGAGALLAAFRRDAGSARERASATLAVTEPFRLPLWSAWSRYALGAAELLEGQAGRAAGTLRAALAEARATGAALFEPFALTTLAESEAAAGHVDEALGHLDEAEQAAAHSGEVFWRPQTRRARLALSARRA